MSISPRADAAFPLAEPDLPAHQNAIKMSAIPRKDTALP